MTDDLRANLILLESRMDHKADRLEVRDAVQAARDHATHGDELVKGEVFTRLARIDSSLHEAQQALTAMTAQMLELRSSLTGVQADAQQQAMQHTPGLMKDWRVLLAAGALAGAGGSQAIKILMGLP